MFFQKSIGIGSNHKSVTYWNNIKWAFFAKEENILFAVGTSNSNAIVSDWKVLSQNKTG